MEDRYPPNAYAGQSRASDPYRPSNAMNPAYMQNSPHSVGAAKGANKAAAAPQGAALYYGGTAGRTNTQYSGAMPNTQQKLNTGTMPYTQNSGTIPYAQNTPNTGEIPYTQEKPNTGALPYAQEKTNTDSMPYTQEKTNTGSGTEAVTEECGYKMGTQPWCAPLSVGYVPFQQDNPPTYSAGDALTRGTLFPGLDLPYLNVVNKNHPYAGTPLGELMALDFVIKELNLYLDTHPNDKDALVMLHSMNKLMAEGSETYVKMYGPISISDLTSGDAYTWLNNPWPWDYTERPVEK